jgi:hypothetical protein
VSGVDPQPREDEVAELDASGDEYLVAESEAWREIKAAVPVMGIEDGAAHGIEHDVPVIDLGP